MEPKTRIEPADPSDLDTIVVPARDDGFQEIFLGQNRWHAVRIHGSMRPQIKYVAVYRVAPTSAITHVATVKTIEPWKGTGKFALEFRRLRTGVANSRPILNLRIANERSSQALAATKASSPS